jgi:type II secretory pathway component GspD/PulD (secretin)
MKSFVAMIALLFAVTVAAQEVFVDPPLTFNDTPMKTALETIFKKAGNVNFSIDVQPLEGTVTINIAEKTELEDLLKMVLTPKDYVAENINNVYHIKKKSAVSGIQSIKVTRLYALTYATAGEVVRQVKGILTKEGNVSVDVGTNSLIITDDPSVFEGIESLLKEIDNPERKAKLISVKAKLLEVQKKPIIEYGMDLKYTIKNAISVAGGSIPELVLGSSNGAQSAFGYNMQLINETTGASVLVPIIASPQGGYVGPINWTGSNGDTFETGFYINENTTKIDMIAEPEVLVEDGTEAKVVIGTKEPIPQYNSTDNGITVTFQYQDVNIQLVVTPASQRDGTIALQINPTMSQLAGDRNVVVDGNLFSAPRIDSREVRTKLFVINGGTIKLGGMYKDRETVTETKVPFLGDLPIVGILFSKRNISIEKTEIQIIVTPHIVDYAPPRCKDTPWISKLEATLLGENDVKLDWSKDLPFGAHGIFAYNVYRDVSPITSLEDRRPFASGISGDSTNWVDTSRKRKGGTYYYVVTSVNPSGMEQSISSDPKFNAMIAIP